MKRRMSAMVGGVTAGITGALLPLVTFAAESGTDFEAQNRAADPGADWGVVMLVTVLATVGLFLVAAIGYGYRRVRGLDWAFQRPDAEHHIDH